MLPGQLWPDVLEAMMRSDKRISFEYFDEHAQMTLKSKRTPLILRIAKRRRRARGFISAFSRRLECQYGMLTRRARAIFDLPATYFKASRPRLALPSCLDHG